MKNQKYILAVLMLLISGLLFSQTQTKNYVQTSTVKANGVVDPLLVNITNAHQSIQYIDGIGRPMQVVQRQATQGQMDLVQVIDYDEMGRETISYLPYASIAGTGNFNDLWATQQSSFYSNTIAGSESTTYPYAVKAWDNSPLNRVVAQGAAGAEWQLNANPVGFDYQTNLANEVPYLSWDDANNTYADSGYYEAGKLFITQTTDENGNITKEYKNFQGQVVLKNSYSGTDVFSTYYIYDDFNNLVCVIPPKAYKTVMTENKFEFIEIESCELERDLVSYYKMDNLNYSFIDALGNNTGGNGGATYGQTGKIGKSLYFDGVNDYCTTGSSSAFGNNLENGFTFSVWIKTNGGVLNIIDNNYYTSFSYLLRVYGTEINLKVHTSSGDVELTGSANVADNDWHHVVATANDDRLAIYVDGNLDVSTELVSNLSFYDKYTYVGVNTYLKFNGLFYSLFKGNMDEFGIWSRGLNDTEIKALYNSGNGFAYPFIQMEEPQTTYLPDSIFKDHVYTYTYDHRNRMTSKNIPGQQEVYMLYDKLDRLVATQDAKMRELGQWLFTKYDAFNRPVATGIYQNRTQTSRDAVQTLVDNETDLFESYDAGTQQYSCITFPVADSIVEYLTYNFYDEHKFIPATKLYLDYTQNDTDFPVWDASTNKGLLTGTKTKILGTENDYLYTTNFYDKKDRLIQSRSEHYKDGYDINNFKYDFIGNPLITDLEHKINLSGTPATTTQKWWYAYDHADRLINVKHQVNSQTAQYIIKNEYNDLGQLITKNLHNITAGDLNNGFKQSVKYAYNIRGWLKSINNPDDLTTHNDLFGMKLLYNEGFADLNGDKMYNGNISGMQWRVQGTDSIRGYGFTYDSINRLKTASYAEKATFFDQNADHYTVSKISYDLNGNIQGLNRQGENTGTQTFGYGAIDQLTYDYIGNTLIAVNDDIADIGNNDFSDRQSNGVLEYAYDVNGNMIRDDNKGIINIIYNYLNLPSEIDFGDGKKIIYLYDANGTKLEKQVLDPTNGNSTKTYAGSFVYNDGGLEYALFEEGRLVLESTEFKYQYFLKDHLGNTRVTFNAENVSILQQDHYYPFGMNFSGIDYTASGVANFYKYNGKELQDNFGLNWYDYGARMLDVQIGRWHSIDPLAENYLNMTPYNYVMSNPLIFVDPNGMAVKSVAGGFTFTGSDAQDAFSILHSFFGNQRNNSEDLDEDNSEEKEIANNTESKEEDQSKSKSNELGPIGIGISFEIGFPNWLVGKKKAFGFDIGIVADNTSLGIGLYTATKKPINNPVCFSLAPEVFYVQSTTSDQIKLEGLPGGGIEFMGSAGPIGGTFGFDDDQNYKMYTVSGFAKGIDFGYGTWKTKTKVFQLKSLFQKK